MFDENQMDQLAEMLSARLVDKITDKVFEGVVERIAGFADDGMDDGLDGEMGDLPPDDAGSEMMGAGVGPATLPGMVGGGDEDAERYEDEDDDMPMDDDPEGGDGMFGGDDDGEEDFDSYDDEGDEPEDDDEEEDEAPEDEDEERYFAGDRMIPGKKRVRNESNCDTGKGMKNKQQYKSDPGDGVVLERYQGDAELVRYEKAIRHLDAQTKAQSKTITKLQRTIADQGALIERYAKTLDATNHELVLRDREKELNDLAAEGYVLDVDEELARTERYSHEQFDGHVELIRARYSREIPEEGFIPTGPVTRRPGVQSDVATKEDAAEFVRYSASIANELPLDPDERLTVARERYKKYKQSSGS